MNEKDGRFLNFIPTRGTMQKLIMRASQLKNNEDGP